MAQQRFSMIYDDAMDPRAGRGTDTQTGEVVNEPQSDPATVDSASPAAPPTQGDGQTSGADPGPSPSPGRGQSGPPPTPAGPPPAIPSAVRGVGESETTGGVQGSFGQAGTADFAKRFGGNGPAMWFRNAGRTGAIQVAGVPGADRGRSGVMQGGAPGAGVSPTIPEPSSGPSDGNQNDEQWQRFIREVMRQRFGAGGF